MASQVAAARYHVAAIRPERHDDPLWTWCDPHGVPHEIRLRFQHQRGDIADLTAMAHALGADLVEAGPGEPPNYAMISWRGVRYILELWGVA